MIIAKDARIARPRGLQHRGDSSNPNRPVAGNICDVLSSAVISDSAL